MRLTFLLMRRSAMGDKLIHEDLQEKIHIMSSHYHNLSDLWD